MRNNVGVSVLIAVLGVVGSVIVALITASAQVKSASQPIEVNLNDMRTDVSEVWKDIYALQAENDALTARVRELEKITPAPVSTQTTANGEANPATEPAASPAPVRKTQYLSKFDYFNYQTSSSGGNWIEDIHDDYVYDNTRSRAYSNGIMFRLSSEGNVFKDYLINGEYTKLQGVFALTYPERTTDRSGALYIYDAENDLLLFTSAAQTNGAMPEIVDVDITGVNLLRVEARCSRASTRMICAFYEAELVP